VWSEGRAWTRGGCCDSQPFSYGIWPISSGTTAKQHTSRACQIVHNIYRILLLRTFGN
jgi:hypothetical protein